LDLFNIIDDANPAITKGLELSYIFDKDSINLFICLNEDFLLDDKDYDTKAIKKMEAWVKKIIKKFPSLVNAVEETLSSDWHSSMKFNGQRYNHYAFFIYFKDAEEE
jgi:hypothetical protein